MAGIRRRRPRAARTGRQGLTWRERRKCAPSPDAPRSPPTPPAQRTRARRGQRATPGEAVAAGRGSANAGPRSCAMTSPASPAATTTGLAPRWTATTPMTARCAPCVVRVTSAGHRRSPFLPDMGVSPPWRRGRVPPGEASEECDGFKAPGSARRRARSRLTPRDAAWRSSMPSGGARSRSGPAADPNALRRRSGSGGDDWLTLPRSGRSGRAPAWPLSKANARERELWTRLWKSPQAVAWEQLLLLDQVALYCRRLAVAERPDATAAEATLARQLQDALGLSAPGLRSMRWKIDDPAPAAKPTAGVRSSRDRLRVVASDGRAS